MYRSHYNQKARLKGFARRVKPNNTEHYLFTYVDLKEEEIGCRNIERAFVEPGLYSDELEKELSEKIESQGIEVIRKVIGSEKQVSLTCSELEILMKYLLIQDYRNPANIATYSPDWEGDFWGINQVFTRGDETYEEYVDRIMREILNHPWAELLNSDEEEIRQNVQMMQDSKLMFIKTGNQFVINDSGVVTERHYLQSNQTPSRFDDRSKTRPYYDNFKFYPISSHYGIIVISKLWADWIDDMNPQIIEVEAFGERVTVLDPNFYRRIFLQTGYCSPLIEKNYTPCINSSPKTDKHGIDQKEVFVYPVVDIGRGEADYLNRLTINETQRYFAFEINLDGHVTVDNYEMNRLIDSSFEYKQNLSWIPEDIKEWEEPLDH